MEKEMVKVEEPKSKKISAEHIILFALSGLFILADKAMNKYDSVSVDFKNLKFEASNKNK